MDTGSQPRRVAPHQSTDGHGESASEGSSTPDGHGESASEILTRMDTGSQPRRVAPYQSTDGHMESARRVAPHRPTDGHGESVSEGSSTPANRWTRGVSLGG